MYTFLISESEACISFVVTEISLIFLHHFIHKVGGWEDDRSGTVGYHHGYESSVGTHLSISLQHVR